MRDKKAALQDLITAIEGHDKQKADTLFTALAEEAERAGDKDAVQMRIALWAGMAAGIMKRISAGAEERPILREQVGLTIKAAKHFIGHLEQIHAAMPEETEETTH